MLSLGGLVWLVKPLVFSTGVKPCWAGVVFGRATVWCLVGRPLHLVYFGVVKIECFLVYFGVV